jgi:hypothetical protein
MTEITQPTPDQVRNAKLAARLARPVAPVPDADQEAERAARVAAGVAVLRAHQERETAERERFIQAIEPLYGRKMTPAVRLLIGPIIGDLRSLLGAMVPAADEPRRDTTGRFAKR